MSDGARCSACGNGTVWRGVCSRCGYAEGKANECPHCGAIARAEPPSALLEASAGSRPGDLGSATWRCAVCGGPRIPGGWGGEAAKAALREQKGHLGRATASAAAIVGFAALACMALLFMLGVLLVSSALVIEILAAAIPGVFALLAVQSAGRRRAARAKAREASERAWLAAAEDAVSRARQGLSPAELGDALTIDPALADALLTKLAVHERARIDVGDDAEVRYSLAPEVRVRVGGDGGGADLTGADADAAEGDAVSDAARVERAARKQLR